MPEPDASPASKPTDTASPRPRAGRGWWLASIPIAFAAGLALGYIVWGRQTPSAAPAAPQANEPRRYPIDIDDDPQMGPDDAPILLIEFSDYNCPFCRKWHQETFPALMSAYPDRIRFVYRDLPVVGGGQVGLEAAQAANCAGDQGAYWEFHDALMSGRYGLSRQAYLQYAADLALDAAALEECLDSRYHEQEVLADRAYALQWGIGSTPTFFVNGIAIVGAQPAAVFQQIIDSELERGQ